MDLLGEFEVLQTAEAGGWALLIEGKDCESERGLFLVVEGKRKVGSAGH